MSVQEMKAVLKIKSAEDVSPQDKAQRTAPKSILKSATAFPPFEAFILAERLDAIL